MLRLSLVGNLGGDPEIGSTQRGAAIATLRVAVNQHRTDTSTGERQEYTEWFRVRAMGPLVELAERLSKGGRILVIGRFQIAHYQTREGEPRVSYDVWADELVSLNTLRDVGGARREDESRRPASATPTTDRPDPPARIPPAANLRRTTGEDAEDDLPW